MYTWVEGAQQRNIRITMQIEENKLWQPRRLRKGWVVIRACFQHQVTYEIAKDP